MTFVKKDDGETVPDDWRNRPFLPLPMAAGVLSCSLPTLYKREQEGVLIFKRLGDRCYVDTKSLIEYVDSAAEWTPDKRLGAKLRTARAKGVFQ